MLRPYFHYSDRLKIGEPLYRSCHVRVEVKDPVKAGQLEDPADWGLKGCQANIPAIAPGALVVADQGCQAGAIHKTHPAKVNDQPPAPFSQKPLQFLSQPGAVPRIHLPRNHYYGNPMVVVNSQLHL